MTQEFTMDSSHKLTLADLPIPTGDKFTVIVLRENLTQDASPARKVYAHRIAVDSLELPGRESLYEK